MHQAQKIYLRKKYMNNVSFINYTIFNQKMYHAQYYWHDT